MYDLRRDPHYMTNVATNPEYADVRARLEARLLATLEAENDPRLTEEPCRYEYEPYAGPVDRAWFEGSALYETVRDAAE